MRDLTQVVGIIRNWSRKLNPCRNNWIPCARESKGHVRSEAHAENAENLATYVKKHERQGRQRRQVSTVYISSCMYINASGSCGRSPYSHAGRHRFICHHIVKGKKELKQAS